MRLLVPFSGYIRHQLWNIFWTFLPWLIARVTLLTDVLIHHRAKFVYKKWRCYYLRNLQTEIETYWAIDIRRCDQTLDTDPPISEPILLVRHPIPVVTIHYQDAFISNYFITVKFKAFSIYLRELKNYDPFVKKTRSSEDYAQIRSSFFHYRISQTEQRYRTKHQLFYPECWNNVFTIPYLKFSNNKLYLQSSTHRIQAHDVSRWIAAFVNIAIVGIW